MMPSDSDTDEMTSTGDEPIAMEIPTSEEGVQPALSLTRSPRNANGLLGMGWALTGIPRIERCAATLAEDGFVDPVDFDSNDRFCLGSQKLKVVEGAYGQDGAKYRLAGDALTEVESYGAVGGGPRYFLVKPASGEILEFGNTADSRRAPADQDAILQWGVNRVTDRLGFFYTVHYQEDAPGTSLKPDRIVYTASAATPAMHAIVFRYEDRPDPQTQYVGGVPMVTSQRLAAIDIFTGDERVRQYLFEYALSPLTRRSLLVDVSVCETQDSCESLGVFEDASDDADFITQVYDASVGMPDGELDDYRVAAQGDFNGDGRDDLYLYSADRDGNANGDRGAPDEVWLGENDGTFMRLALNPFYGLQAGDEFIVGAQGDFNGDGIADLYLLEADEDRHSTGNPSDVIWLGNLAGTFEDPIPLGPQMGISGPDMDEYRVAAHGDFNGDGRTDLYLYKADPDDNANGEAAFPDQVWLSRDEGGFERVTDIGAQAGNEYRVAAQGDFNGDGLTDLYWYESDGEGNATSSAKDEVWLSLGNGHFRVINLQGGGLSGPDMDEYRVAASGDFNGDQLTDLFLYRAQDNDGRADGDDDHPDQVWLAKGDGTFERFLQIRASANDYHVQAAGDFNGDGLTDLYLIAVDSLLRSSGVSSEPDEVRYAQGDGFFRIVPRAEATPTEFSVVGVGDFDGDGLTDLYLYEIGKHGRATGDETDRQYRAQRRVTSEQPDAVVIGTDVDTGDSAMDPAAGEEAAPLPDSTEEDQ